MNPVMLILIIAGIFSILGGVFNWDWFMNHRKARSISAVLSRQGARIFYVVLGMGLVILAALMMVGTVPMT